MGKWLFRWLDSFMPHTHDAETPCNHMKQMLSDLSDDTASGIKRWYALQHVAGCPGCSYTLEVLKSLRDRLSRLGRTENDAGPSAIPPLALERRVAVEAAWAKLDETINS